jgi:transglutaminase-like putative cysteine protease
MTDSNADLLPGPILPAPVRRVLAGPAEGWLTLLFVMLMALTVAWSLDDAAWVLGEPDWGDFYAPVAIMATLLGFIAAKARWPRWMSHFIAAATAAIVVPLLVGMVLVPEGSPGEQYRATAASTVKAWIELQVRPVTVQYGHHLLAFGLVVWSVGQFAAYAVFGHRRPLDAVIVVGLLLLGNIALTSNDQLTFLIIFSIAALGVLARAHAFEEQATWLRRRIGDAGAVRSIYLRGGTVFITAAVLGSLALTASASSDPLAGAWDDVTDRIVEVSQGIQRWLPFGGNNRPVAFGFGDRAVISGKWQVEGLPSAVVQVAPDEAETFYWRVVTFDRFDFNSWTWSQTSDQDRAAGDAILAGQADDPESSGARREVRVQVIPEARSVLAISPQDPEAIDQSSRAVLVGDTGFFGAVRLSDGRTPYVVRALVPVFGDDDPRGITANRLRATQGMPYPAEIRARYLQPSPGALGVQAQQLLATVRDRAGSNNPYDLAFEMERYLRSSNFRYNPDVTGLAGCAQMGAVECFATFRQGYCLHYASTMAMLLREAGIPTRLAEGFLPSRRSATGREQLNSSSAHAWVEVYFPTYGWVKFDPTGGGGGGPPTEIVEGSPVPPSVAPTFDPSFVIGSREPLDDRPSGRPGTTPAGSGRNSGPGPGLMIAIAVTLLVAVLAVAFLAWERGPRGEVTPDTIWRGISRTAARFGFGPKPTQTVYEYAGSLGEVLPMSRPELQTVARAKVEVAYGRRSIGDDGLQSLRDASRKLRMALLRLAFRRKERRARKRRKG